MVATITQRGTEWVVACHGLRLCLWVDDPRWLPRLRQTLPPDGFRSTCAGAGVGTDDVIRHFRLNVRSRSNPRCIYVNGRCVERGSSAQELPEAVERQVDSLVAEHAPRHLGLHAGTVGLFGGAVLVAGSSMSGKSSLVEALVRAGASYLSDDLAMIDGELRVHPYPRLLRRREAAGERRIDPRASSVQSPGESPGESSAESAESSADLVADQPLPVRWVILPSYRAGARFEPKPLHGGAALLALLAHTIPARRTPGRALDLLGRLVTSARVLTGVRGEADETAKEILDLAGRDSGRGAPVPPP